MAKKPVTHPYSDQAAFDRLMVLLTTLIKHPGVSSRDAKQTPHQDALEDLHQHMQNTAQAVGIPLAACALSTLRKDLATLRHYGALDRNRYDWGYYLGTGAMAQEDLPLVLNALASQATYQGDARVRRLYQTLSQRFKRLNLESQGQLFYPVRAHFNRAIVHTDPDEMLRKQENRNTLFHDLETLERAIVQGLPIEIYLSRNLYAGKVSYRQVYPLQLLYYDVAWYLVMEDVSNGHLAISRLDRFTQYLRILDATGRGLEAQHRSLQVTHQLLRNGWGLNLGNPDEQQMERQGTLPLLPVKVRFFAPTSRFIQEGERRHIKQKILPGPNDETTGEPAYVDYVVKLPERSLNEFSFWVFRHMENAQVLSPPTLVEKHQQAIAKLATRYTLQENLNGHC
ncbi:MAG: WYL domain-containing protein [Myxacorys californica WJT36-NPBG1]|jgi:predicted DNA-binding transcriptional regulator YafY|nr:WYL domain-containing protein [Myxacorys californica WJT36-NPBG1]